MSAEFRRLTALEELKLNRSATELKYLLMAKGVEEPDAEALAHNTALVWLGADWGEERPASPLEVLALLSLGEIADLCEEYGRFLAEGTSPSPKEVGA